MVRNKKGAWSFQQLGGIILVLLVVVAIAINFIPRIAKAGQTGSELFDAGNCDGDGPINSIDLCPCLSTGGLEGTLRGCPIGISQQEANKDKLTCKWFATTESSCGGLSSSTCFEKSGTAFYSNCDGDNKEQCIKKSDESFKTRCDLVSETAIGVTEKKGLAGNWDLTVSELKIFDWETAEESTDGTFDLENTYNSQELEVDFYVENVGEENIPKPFSVSIQVCNENREVDSCETKSTFEVGPLRSGETVSPLDLVESIHIEVGKGDHCDGAGSTKCSLRVIVDSTEALGETDETNNDVWFPIWLQNKKSEKINWVTKKSIEIFADDDEKLPFQTQIHATCEGFFGGGNGGDPETSPNCDTQDDDCDDAGESRTSLPPSGCLVHASEDDAPDENDCGWAGAKVGFVLPHLSHRNIDLATAVTGDKEAEVLFLAYKWQSKAEGSLLCAEDKSWYLCDSDVEREGKVLPVGGKRFKCKDRGWEELR